MYYSCSFGSKFLIPVILSFSLLFTNESRAQVMINEVVASNGTTLTDEDGEQPDWIELLNTSDMPVDLSGYGLTDDLTDPFKYRIPQLVLAPDSYYLIFASDKDRPGFTAYWNTVISEGSPAKYIVPNSAVSTSWVDPGYDDSSWNDGIYGIGYGDNDDATEVPSGIMSVFSRSTFSISDPAEVSSIALHVDYDDGYIAYLNGTEIYRKNIEGDAPVPYNTGAVEFTEPRLAYGQELEGAILSNATELLVSGENVLAIQMHNFNTNSSDLTLIPFLTVGFSSEITGGNGVSDPVPLPAFQSVYPHANFKLSAAGETVYLIGPDSVLVDELIFPPLQRDESYGRGAENISELFIYPNPTPGEENNTEGFQDRLSKPVLNIAGGFFEGSVTLELVDPTMTDKVYYTTDGSEPTENSTLFGETSLIISTTTTLKLRAIESGKLSSNIITHSYFIGSDHDLPVVSITTDPENLWSDESGIYVRGTNGVAGFCTDEANWNQDWEIPVNIELYEADGSKGFNSGAGAKIYGGCSRNNPAKSLAIFFRGEYGNTELEYKLFEEKELYSFQAFVLRNSGNDFTTDGGSMMRDGLMKTLIEDTDLDYQAYKPVVLYLNGEYWGIHNIREKINEHFLASNGYADSEEVDLIENNSLVVHGYAEKWDEFLSALGSANMNDPAAYAEVEDMIDIDNYIDYMASEIYFANTDWPGNNQKFWRNRLTNGKWRWIIYDTDFGFGLHYGGQKDHNTLAFALEPNGPGWPNPPWSTYVFRRMTQSPVFVEKFTNRMSDLINTSFHRDHVLAVIDSLAGRIAPEIPNNQVRWGRTVADWEYRVEVLRDFARNRRFYVEGDFQQVLGVSSPRSITVDVNNTEFGDVRVNRLEPASYPWSGSYFSGNEVEISAIAKEGYRFIGWSGDIDSDENPVKVNPNISLTANFELSDQSSSTIVINEIMYNDSETVDTGDWIELHNPGSVTLNISGWTVKDEDDTHVFTFPAGTEMPANSYLVIASNLVDFNTYYDEVSPLFGELGYGLAGGSDQVRLFNAGGTLIDSLQYNDEGLWPSGPDGTGFTLELTDPALDNADPESWSTSTTAGGSPGSQNTVYAVSSEEDPQGAVPSKVSLSQNYPNPFNPSTTITYELPVQSKVRLTVFDMLGRHIATLEEGIRSGGTHTVNWDASQQASGIYLYRLEIGDRMLTKKMILLK